MALGAVRLCNPGGMDLDPKSPSMKLWHRLLALGVSEDEATELMNGYAHELAERIRYGDYPAHATDGAEYAADVIDPWTSQPGTYVLSTRRPGVVGGPS